MPAEMSTPIHVMTLYNIQTFVSSYKVGKKYQHRQPGRDSTSPVSDLLQTS
jgi:hypothetical protein